MANGIIVLACVRKTSELETGSQGEIQGSD
jgi:hypothetical protein